MQVVHTRFLRRDGEADERDLSLPSTLGLEAFFIHAQAVLAAKVIIAQRQEILHLTRCLQPSGHQT